MEPIRILLVAMPQLMSDIVELGLEPQPDMEVVGVLESVVLLTAAARLTRPDFLILGVDGTQLPEECGPALAERPQIRVVGIEQEAAEATLYELRPHGVSLGAVSPDDLAVAIRAAAGSPVLWKVC